MERTRSITPGCWVKIIVVLILILVLKKLDWLPSWNIFRSKGVTIDNTAIIIKEVRSLGQVITATFYDEVVVDSTIKHRFPQLPITDDRIVIIARGKVYAGIDLKVLEDRDVKVSGDTVWIQLPPAKILDVIINPADYETFEERGNWKPDAVTLVKVKARSKIVDDANSKNLVVMADNKARSVLEEFLNAAGFKVVVFKKMF